MFSYFTTKQGPPQVFPFMYLLPCKLPPTFCETNNSSISCAISMKVFFRFFHGSTREKRHCWWAWKLPPAFPLAEKCFGQLPTP